MATFQQIAANVVIGAATFAGCVAMFEGAIRLGYHMHLAPRTWNRPGGAIENALLGRREGGKGGELGGKGRHRKHMLSKACASTPG